MIVQTKSFDMDIEVYDNLLEKSIGQKVLENYAGKEYTKIEIDSMRKTIISRLTAAKQTIPHYYPDMEDKILRSEPA